MPRPTKQNMEVGELVEPDDPGGLLYEICHRMRKFAWFKFCRLEIGFTDEEIDIFVEAFVMENDLYLGINDKWDKVKEYLPPYLRTRLAQIEKKLSCLEDSATAEDHFERSDLSKQKKKIEEMLSTEVDYSTMDDSTKKQMIYDIIGCIPPRARGRFCQEQLGITPEKKDFPIDDVLKMEMLLFWWENKAEKNSANLASLMNRTEAFFKRNRGSERKRSNENLFVNCKIKKVRLVTI